MKRKTDKNVIQVALFVIVMITAFAGNASANSVQIERSMGLSVLEIPYQEDFETGWNGWSADNGVWQVGNPTAGPDSCHSGSNCAGKKIRIAFSHNAYTFATMTESTGWYIDDVEIILPASIQGDIDGDGYVTASYALLYLRYAVGQNIAPYSIDISDDVTCDGNIFADDALLVLRKAVNQPVDLTCPRP